MSATDLVMHFAFSELLGSLYNAALSVCWLAAAHRLPEDGVLPDGQ